jgi:hypothetical protein
MYHRLSKTVVALGFALALALSTPTASASVSRYQGSEPGFGSQIVRFLKNFAHKFFVTSQDDVSTIHIGPPIP